MNHDIALGFACGARIDDLRILGVEGREWIHRPYEIDVLLAKPGAPLSLEEVDALLGSRAVVAFGEGPRDRMRGAIESVVHLDTPRSSVQMYVARMIPEVGLMNAGRRSAVYQDLSIPELVGAVLEAHGLTRGNDFELRLRDASTSPKREYIVQYQESDWSFLARWLEHEGMSCVFEHLADRTAVVVLDDNLAAPRIDDAVIPYRLRNNVSSGGIGTMWNATVSAKQVVRLVSVADYNFRRPAEVIFAAHEVATPAFGHVALYGEHPKDTTEAGVLARIRAEAASANRRVMSATTDRSDLRSGHRFELENHPCADYDGEWLVVRARFGAGMPIPREGAVPQRDEARRYRSLIDAIPSSVPFRPERVTPWPSIHGVMHGHVQGDGSGEVAEIDELGRYKVRMPFALATKPGLGASRWIRKAQPYAGAGYGMHFPLHKGTEVLIAHIDGDPDRPIIVGAVPHAVTPSPVNRVNATQSVIQSASGIRVEMEDRHS